MNASGAASGRPWWAINAAILLVSSFVLSSCGTNVSALSPKPTPVIEHDNKIITVLVYDPNNQLIEHGAIVRVSGDSAQVDTDDDGGYYVQACIQGQTIGVWAPGYAIHWEPCVNGATQYSVKLSPLVANTNPSYSWLSAETCRACHSNLGDHNEFNEWQLDGHSKVFTNQFFGTMYSGTDVYKNPGTLTNREITSGGQQVRQRSDSRYGPGYLLDYPYDQGNCAYCHVPAMIQGGMQVGSLRDVVGGFSGYPSDVRTEGVTCDICHKVIDTSVVEGQLPYSDRPGMLSLAPLPPDNGNPFSFMIGPSENVLPTQHNISCAPMMSESRFCAACHYGQFFNSVMYNSYGEWLTSGYAVRKKSKEGIATDENPDYRSCQDCHMLSVDQLGTTLHSERSACSVDNTSFQNFSHNMMKYEPETSGSSKIIPKMITNAALLDVGYKFESDADIVTVVVKVLNTRAGHKFPTDSPLRHLLLVVDVMDELGNPLPLQNGSAIPVWGGVGKNVPGMPNYGGRPGKVFALILADNDTGDYPTAAYWNPTQPVLEDNRLSPGQPDESTYAFIIPRNRSVHIKVDLVYRYAFIDLAEKKGWLGDDVLVTSKQCQVSVHQTEAVACQ